MPTNDDGRDADPVRADGPADDGTRLLAQSHYDPKDRVSLATVVVTVIGDARGVDAVDVRDPLLHDVVDVEAVESLLFRTLAEDDHGRTGGTVRFEYDGNGVAVHGDGWVQVYEDVDEEPSEQNPEDEASDRQAEDGASERQTEDEASEPEFGDRSGR
jgi:hypothetical protein